MYHVNITVSASIFAGHDVLKKTRFVNDHHRCVFIMILQCWKIWGSNFGRSVSIHCSV